MKKITIILLVFLALGIQSCDKFFDVNNNPNQPTDAPYYMVHPRAVLGTAAVTGGTYAIVGCLWSEHFTQNHTASQYRAWVENSITGGSFGSSFDALYLNAIKHYELVREKAAEAENWKYYLMATVMEAYTFQVLADLHNDIPFSEAVQGLTGLIHPKYDKCEDVYTGIVSRIDEALGKDFDVSTNNAGEAATYDKIFGGDVNKWKQFANTLKLRIFLRQRYVKPEVLNKVKELLGKNNFLSVDAKIGGFTNALGKANPLYGQEVASYGSTNGHGNVNLRACNTLLNFLNSNNDSRLPRIYTTVPSQTTYRGLDYGDRPSTAVVPNNGLSLGQFSASDPVVFISAAESQFLQAEAKEWAGESGKANYDAGVLASFEKYGLNGASYIAANAAYAYPAAGTTEEKLEAIITQKWLDCVITNPLESFLEFNRTHYPKILIPSKTSRTTGLFPKRMPYSETESNRNPNCPDPNTISIGNKVWWDKKP